MQSISKRIFTLSLLISSVLATACPSQVTISKINADPSRYARREVALVGRVTNSYGALGRGAYELDDGTGRIWVATQRGVPSKGSRVGLTGRVISGFNFGGMSLGTAIEESDRRSKDR